MNNRVCYFDNAATSFPKPKNMLTGVNRCICEYGGNAGRGSHRLSLMAAEKIYECREHIQALVNADSPESVAFVPSCTYGINLVIKGILKRGDHVLISDMEHNSVRRPLEKLQKEGKITFSVFPALSKSSQSDEELLEGIRMRIQRNTRLLICNHQSNICSYSLPIEKIGELCKKNNILFAVDGAQSIGHYNIDVQKMNINYLISPAHKGLYGLQGAGFIVFNGAPLLDTLVEGGVGIDSMLTDMPTIIPERYEAGTLPLPSIVGLLEGIKSVSDIGINKISAHDCSLFRQLRDGLLNISGTTVYLPEHEGSTLLFNIANVSAERVSEHLDSNLICVRSGLHCAPLAHKALGTEQIGAVRVSFGIFNTISDIDRILTYINSLK